MIALMTICEWTAGSRHDAEVRDPSWDEIARAIRALDGAARNDLYLCPDADDPGTYLCVGGGDGRYVVAGAIAIDSEFPTLVDADRPATPMEVVVVGGQAGRYPANWVVGLDAALAAARAFYDARGFGGGFPWARI